MTFRIRLYAWLSRDVLTLQLSFCPDHPRSARHDRPSTDARVGRESPRFKIFYAKAFSLCHD